MKRKIAFALAAVMAVSTVIPMNLFAATTNRLTGYQLQSYDAGTLLVDGQKNFSEANKLKFYQNGVSGATTPGAYFKYGDTTQPRWAFKGDVEAGPSGAFVQNNYNADLANNGTGTSVSIIFEGDEDAVTISRAFRLQLDNASWAFYKQPALFTAGGVPSQVDNTYGTGLVKTTNRDNSIVAGDNGYAYYVATDSILRNTYTELDGMLSATAASGYAAVPDGYTDFYDATAGLPFVIKTALEAKAATFTTGAMTPAQGYAAMLASYGTVKALVEAVVLPALTQYASDVYTTAAKANANAQVQPIALPYDKMLTYTTAYYNAAVALPAGVTALTVTPHADATALATAISALFTGGIFDTANTTYGIVPNPALYAGDYDKYVSGVVAVPGTNHAVNYTLAYENDSTVIVTYYGNVKKGDGLVIPIVAVTKSTGAVKVTIPDYGNNQVTRGDIGVSTTGATGTVISISDSSAYNANYRMKLGDIRIDERTLGRIIANGQFYIDAPAGYHFTNTNVYDGSPFPITFGYGPSIYKGTQGVQYNVNGSYAWRRISDNVSEDRAEATRTVGPNVDQQQVYYNSTANSRIYFNTNDILTEAKVYGYLTISGLIMAQDDPTDADYYRDLYINISDTTATKAARIGSATLKITQRTPWALSFGVAKVVNGFSGWRNMANVDKWNNNLSLLQVNPQTISEPITVTLKENSIQSWWSDKDTTFMLCDKDGNQLNDVKFSEVKVTTTNIANGMDYTWNDASFPSRYTVAADRNVIFAKDGHSVTLFDLQRSGTWNRTGVTLKFRISADANFEGDVYIKLANDRILETEIDSGLVPQQIATLQKVVKIETKKSEIQIGYQTYKVADITITENQPGLIQSGSKNNIVSLMLGEYGTGIQTKYMYFGPVTADKNLTVNKESGMKISNFGVSGTTAQANKINFTVTKRTLTPINATDSKTYVPASIELKGLIINIDRTTPEGNYDFIVGGSAITDNTDTIINSSDNFSINGKYDFFATQGVVYVDYLKVATPGSNKPFSDRVVVKDGSDVAMINKETEKQMGSPAFIDTTTNRMMVPVRFVSEALGVDPLNVRWDGKSGTCTIWTDEKVIAFVNGQSTMTINNQPFELKNDDGTPVIPQIYAEYDRMYIPFRALGDAIGINVMYDDATGEAIYNPDIDEYQAYLVATGANTAVTAE